MHGRCFEEVGGRCLRSEAKDGGEQGGKTKLKVLGHVSIFIALIEHRIDFQRSKSGTPVVLVPCPSTLSYILSIYYYILS